jgi:hypothetical protein
MGERKLQPDVFLSGLNQLGLLRATKVKRIESFRF